MNLGFPGGTVVKNLPANAEVQRMQVGSLDAEDPLEKEMATQSSILVWNIPCIKGAWRATVHRVAKSGTRLSD